MKFTFALPVLSVVTFEASLVLCAPVGRELSPFERASFLPAPSNSVSTTSSKDLHTSASWKQSLKRWLCIGPPNADENDGIASNGPPSLPDCVPDGDNSEVPYPYPPEPVVVGGNDFDFEDLEPSPNPAQAGDFPATPKPSRHNSDAVTARPLEEALNEEAELATAMSRDYPQPAVTAKDLVVDNEEEARAYDPRMLRYGTEEEAYLPELENNDETVNFFDKDNFEQGSEFEGFDELEQVQDVEIGDEDADQELEYESDLNGFGEVAPEYKEELAEKAPLNYIQDLVPGDENVDSGRFPKHFDDDVVEQSRRFIDNSADAVFQEESAALDQDVELKDPVEPAVAEGQDVEVQLAPMETEPVEVQGEIIEAETEDYFTNPVDVAQGEDAPLDVAALEEEAKLARKKSNELAASMADFLHNPN